MKQVMTRLTNPEGTKPSNSQHFEQIFSSDVIDRIYREVLVAIKDQIDWEKEFGINISPIDCVSEESLRGIPLLGAKVEVSASSSFAKVQHGLSANAPLNLRQQKLPVITISRDTFSLTEDIRLTFLCATGSNFAYSLMVHELIHVMQMTQISSIDLEDLEDPEINKLKAVTAVASLAATAWQINYPGIQAELISALIFIYSLITLKNKKSPAYDPMVKVTMEIHAYFVQAMCPSIDLIGQYLSNPEALFDRIKTEYIDSNKYKI